MKYIKVANSTKELCDIQTNCKLLPMLCAMVNSSIIYYTINEPEIIKILNYVLEDEYAGISTDKDNFIEQMDDILS